MTDAIERFHKISRLNFGVSPTPIEEMPRLRAALGGGPRLFIKHDDYTGPGFGGNKIRKLEYIFAAATADGADAVITIGGVRSNHARATAALAAKAGLECHLILNGDADRMPASMYLDQLYGAVIHRVKTREERTPEMQRVAAELREQGRHPKEIPLGASSPLGAMGSIRAAEEIARSGIGFDWIFHATSSGGTQAGMDAGLQIFEQKARLVGVSADDSAQSISNCVAGIVGGIAMLLDLDNGVLQREIAVDDKFAGEGYGIPSREGNDALKLLASVEGIVLDPVYTAKAMAGMIARIRAGSFSEDQKILFLHTGGQLALFAADIQGN